MNPKPRRTHRADVMVSSTTKDLAPHRASVVNAIIKCGLYPLAMENRPASPANAIHFSLTLVNEAEVYVGIFGNRYGDVPENRRLNPGGISYTEMEYRRAQQRGIPCFIFMLDEDITLQEPESEAKQTKLAALKDELKKNHVVAFFKTPEELGQKVYEALMHGKEQGFFGSDPTPTFAFKTLPLPPQPFYAHQHEPTKFFGRKRDLAALDDWALSGDQIMVIEAIGGIGKTSLAWEWVHHHLLDLLPNLAGMVWWSFYASDGSIRNWVTRTLGYIEGVPVDEIENLPFDSQINRLLNALQNDPYLIVFDGIERIFATYHRYDAPQLREEDVEQAVAAEALNPRDPSDDRRNCIDPRHGDLLRQLISVAPTRILITTRLFPADLEDRHSGKILPGIRHHRLLGLETDDAIDLLFDSGVKRGDRATIGEFLAQFGNHGLLVKVIGGEINKYAAAPGDFDQWYAERGKALNLADLNIVQRRTHILHYALKGLNSQQFEVLALLAAFRHPVPYEALKTLNPFLPKKLKRRNGRFTDMLYWLRFKPVDSSTSEFRQIEQARTDFEDTLQELNERGLLIVAAEGQGVYDLHPLVRAYTIDRLEEQTRRKVFMQVKDHFEGIPPKERQQIRNLNDLERDLQIYYALLNARLWNEASDFYRDRLQDVLQYQLAAYKLIVELLTPLFQDGIENPPILSGAHRQSARMTNLANAYHHVGEKDKAWALRGKTLKVFLDNHDPRNLGISLRNYASSLREEYDFAGCLRVRQLARELAEAAQDGDGRALSHLYLLALYEDMGWWNLAERAYQNFYENLPSDDVTFWQGVAERHRAEMFLSQGHDAEAILDHAEELAILSQNALGQIILLRLRGESALQRGAGGFAIDYFSEAITRARQASVDPTREMGGLARAFIAAGKTREARDLLAKGLTNEDAAEVWLHLGEANAAETCARAGFTRAWANGYPYVRWWRLERCKRVLENLRADLPSLRPHDPHSLQPIDYEDEIRAYIEHLRAAQ